MAADTQRRVLFIAPRFFGYEREIADEIAAAGFTVDYYDERPSAAASVKVALRLFPELVGTLAKRYANRVIAETAERSYEVVFMIKGEGFSAPSVAALRKAHPSARFVFYTFDSLSNIRNVLRKLPLFDKAYSFDRFDCAKQPKLHHLPLFYSRRIARVAARAARDQTPRDIDLMFIGSLHSDRYSVVARIVAAARAAVPDVTVYSFWFYQSRWVFAARKLLDRRFRFTPLSIVRWRALDKDSTDALLVRAKALVDVEHLGQTGLTMRTVESVGLRTKLITTNADVVNYALFHPANILVVDRSSPVVPISFLTTPYQTLSPEVYERYSLRAWVAEILRLPIAGESVALGDLAQHS